MNRPLNMSRRAAMIGVASLATLSTRAFASRPPGYGDKPIKIVVPWAPGGAADFLARTVGARLADRIGTPVVIENRAGGATNLGTEYVANAAPDGHTLLMASSNNCVNVALFPKLKFDFQTAFAPITNVGDAPSIFVVNPAVPARSVKELIALAREKPEALTYASSGNGSAAHLAAERFKQMAKVDILGVPYKGAGPAVADLIGGQTSMMFTVIPATLAHVKAGKLRALGIATPQRLPILPDLPTVAEGGLPGFESSIWYGLVAPAKTPTPIVAYLREEVAAVLRAQDIAERLTGQGTLPIGDTPAHFAKTIATDVAQYGGLVRSANIQVE